MREERENGAPQRLGANESRHAVATAQSHRPTGEAGA
jgi:hypothetical protein